MPLSNVLLLNFSFWLINSQRAGRLMGAWRKNFKTPLQCGAARQADNFAAQAVAGLNYEQLPAGL